MAEAFRYVDGVTTDDETGRVWVRWCGPDMVWQQSTYRSRDDLPEWVTRAMEHYWRGVQAR